MTTYEVTILQDEFGIGPPCEYCGKIIYVNRNDESIKDKFEAYGTSDLQFFHHSKCLKSGAKRLSLQELGYEEVKK